MSDVTIVIPTFRRPADLSRLLSSIDADVGGRSDVRVVVVDNDAAGSAGEAARAASDALRLDIDYSVEPSPGVSNARNAAMARVRSRFVLFLDDDMEVVPPFLDPMMETARKLDAALTFGRAVANLPEGSTHLMQWLGPLFSRDLDRPTALVSETLGTGGCLVDLHGIALPSPVFDPAFNEVGGEDDHFFAQVRAQKDRVAWCQEAFAWEHVPPHRATPDYLWRRHFAFGQTPSQEAADRGLVGAPKVAFWMAVGSVQAALHGLSYGALKLLGRPAHLSALGRCAQGVGKVLWWDGLSPRLYGSAAK